MDLQALRYFVAVAEEGSFTEGAHKAHIVQSAASAAVARLERELETDLFLRTGRQIEITEAGQLLLKRAREIIAAASAARDDIDALAGGLRGTVTLGSILTTGTLDLADALIRFRERNPRVRVEVRLSASPMYGHFSSVLDGTFDALLAPRPPHLPPHIQMDAIGETRIVAVCSSGHPLATRTGVGLEELMAYEHIDFPVAWGNRQLVDNTFATQGLERSVAIEVVDVATALRLAAGDAGIAFVAEQLVDGNPGIAVIGMADRPPVVPLGLAVATEHPPTAAARELREAILASARATAREEPFLP